METEQHAAARGITPLCTLAAAANTCDAYHQTASSPDGKGAYLAMKQALEQAKLSPQQISYINAHGTGTPNNDLSEITAISRLFGRKLPPISSTKPFTGHTTSAAGAIEAVISILALQHSFIPPNLNFKTPMPEHPFEPCTLQMAANAAQTPPELTHILSNSFGFGGNDTALIFSRCDSAGSSGSAREKRA
jgi:3-oxoacyl-[acyl-carrier-protein] synthase-1